MYCIVLYIQKLLYVILGFHKTVITVTQQMVKQYAALTVNC